MYSLRIYPVINISNNNVLIENIYAVINISNNNVLVDNISSDKYIQ